MPPKCKRLQLRLESRSSPGSVGLGSIEAGRPLNLFVLVKYASAISVDKAMATGENSFWLPLPPCTPLCS